MDIKAFINDWLYKSNDFDTEKYLEKWNEDAVLEDPSVGEVFKGRNGIRNYFENYFVDYKTHTRLIKLSIVSDTKAYIEVEFTGEFPERKIGGTFEFIFRAGKIDKAKANLK